MSRRGSDPHDSAASDGDGQVRRPARDDGDDLFASAPQAPLRWHPEARLLLNEVLDKVPSHARGPAMRQAQQQIEALAREWDATEISAELVGVALGGLSMTREEE